MGGCLGTMLVLLVLGTILFALGSIFLPVLSIGLAILRGLFRGR